MAVARGPLVSVVMPAHDAGATVGAAVESALAQSMPELELIVVDDGSGDDTAEVVESIADPRLALLRQDCGGPGAARNAGIRRASGEWIALLDADDIWLPHKLERQLEALEAAPGAGAAQSGAWFVDERLEPLHVQRCRRSKDELLAFLRFQNMPAACSTWIVSRELLDRVGPFDESLPSLEDWHFSIRVARHGNPLGIAEPLALYRVHDGNRSNDFDSLVLAGGRVLDELFADPELPLRIRRREREIRSRFYAMLCGGALRLGQRREAARWGRRAVEAHPAALAYMAQMPVRRLRRRLARTGVCPR